MHENAASFYNVHWAFVRVAAARGRLPLVAHEIHIKTAEGGVVYPSAFSYGREDGDLWVEVGDDSDHTDRIYFAPGYWQQYVVDPHSEDPLDLDLLFDEFDDDEDEEYEEDAEDDAVEE
jgi:hypothetical protein